jgi:hypothetical protein
MPSVASGARTDVTVSDRPATSTDCGAELRNATSSITSSIIGASIWR